MEHTDVSWTPTLVGMMDELVLYIYSLCDAMTIYYMAWTCRRFQRIAKSKSLKLVRVVLWQIKASLIFPQIIIIFIFNRRENYKSEQ